MKVASIVFQIIGTIGNFIYALSAKGDSINWFLAFAIIGLVVGIGAISTACDGKKIVVVGILSMIFTSLLGGIFYLCINDEREY